MNKTNNEQVIEYRFRTIAKSMQKLAKTYTKHGAYRGAKIDKKWKKYVENATLHVARATLHVARATLHVQRGTCNA